MKLESQPPQTSSKPSLTMQGSGQRAEPARRALQSLAAQAGRTSGGASNHGQDAPARTNDRHTGSTSTRILLTLTILGALGTAWGVYSQLSGSSTSIAEGPPDTKVILERGVSPARSSATDAVERVPIRTTQPAFERASAATPKPRSVPNESFAPSDESAAELPVLQALAEPDDETRYQRLHWAVHGGAEVPVDRMHEVLATDPSEKVRELALNALTEHPDATLEQVRAVAEGALANPSLAVRTRAQRILEQMDEAERTDREVRQRIEQRARERAGAR